MIKKGDEVRLKQRNWQNSVGVVDAVFEGRPGLNDGEPWAWVKWSHGGEGAPKLSDLELCPVIGESDSVNSDAAQ